MVATYIEGFCLSSNNTKRAESFGNFSKFGLNAPVITLGTNKIKHTTIDGSWRIEQTFSQQPALKQITVAMKLFNLSGVAQNSIYLTRAVEVEMANTFGGDLFVSGLRSLIAAEPGVNRLKLATTNTQVVNTMIYPIAAPVTNNFCYDPPSDGVNSAGPGDRAMGLLVQLPSVPAGGNATVTFTYQLGLRSAWRLLIPRRLGRLGSSVGPSGASARPVCGMAAAAATHLARPGTESKKPMVLPPPRSWPAGGVVR